MQRVYRNTGASFNARVEAKNQSAPQPGTTRNVNENRKNEKVEPKKSSRDSGNISMPADKK
jgi:hypothetical protein